MRTKEEKQIICDTYLTGKSLNETGKMHNVDRHIVAKYLKELNIKQRPIEEARKEYKINKQFFKEIDSHDKAQILGLWYADGNLYKFKGRTKNSSISLNIEDCEYLKIINSKLGYTRDVKFTNTVYEKYISHMCNIYVNNKEFNSYLESKGIEPRKSLTCKFPTIQQVPDEFLNSFFLGYFEGDGCLYHNPKKPGAEMLMICVTKEFGERMIEITKEKFGIDGYLHYPGQSKKNNVNMYNLRYCGPKKCIKLLEWMYKDCSFRMDRKYKKFLEFRKSYDNNYCFIKSDEWKQNHKNLIDNARKKLNGKLNREFYIKSIDNKIYFSNCVKKFAKNFSIRATGVSLILNQKRNNYYGWTKPTEEEVEVAKKNNEIINLIFPKTVWSTYTYKTRVRAINPSRKRKSDILLHEPKNLS